MRALSRCISAVENGDPRASEIVERMQARAGHAWVIGLTGVPGAGKSTLVSSLAQRLSLTGARPAILAVDPSSTISGGALLGDRIRDQSDTKTIFFRSVASRGSLGGLSGSLDDVVTLLDAAGRDVILIETVGTGQSEIDVTSVAHTTLAVTAPGLGDEIQAMKAGITELADLHVVNKGDADPAGAESTALLLRQRLRDKVGASRLAEGANPATPDFPAAWLAPVRVVSARTGARPRRVTRICPGAPEVSGRHRGSRHLASPPCCSTVPPRCPGRAAGQIVVRMARAPRAGRGGCS